MPEHPYDTRMDRDSQAWLKRFNLAQFCYGGADVKFREAFQDAHASGSQAGYKQAKREERGLEGSLVT